MISANALEEAERILESALREAKQRNDQRGLAIARTSEAAVSILKHKLPRARKLLDESQSAAFDSFEHAERLYSEKGQARFEDAT